MLRQFDFSSIKLNWFPGHMATSLKQIRSRIQQEQVDLIVEVRDARIPRSSIARNLEEGQVKRIIVYTKSDLAEVSSIERIQRLVNNENSSTNDKSPSSNSLLFCKDNRQNLLKLLSLIKSHFMHCNSIVKNRVMVVGIPNVGKSTIINGLRNVGIEGKTCSGKAVKVGNLPGVTRALSELVCISRSPLIYLIDTPGILTPNISNVQEGLKMALCGGLYDKTVGNHILADFLLFNLLTRQNKQFAHFYNLSGLPTSAYENINNFLPLAAARIGALAPGGNFDLDRTAAFFVRQFRSGKFGKITLDHF
jgi:mitochondrial GTPase 1